MKRLQSITFRLFLIAAGLVLPSLAYSQTGAVVSSEALPVDSRVALSADISAARNSNPTAFKRVADIRSKVSEMDAKKRGRFAPVALSLRNVGPDVILPAIEALAFSDMGRGDWTETAWTAWRAGLLEAAGATRDPRGESVYQAILASTDADFYVNRAAAEAFAKLNTDRSASKLIQFITTSGPKQIAMISGAGACRRIAVAQSLGEMLDATPTSDAQKNLALIEALGDVGNAWAWETPISQDVMSEEHDVRSLAAKHLVAAFVRLDGHQRKAALKSILLVNHPSTLSWIASARSGASGPLLKDLDKLQSRFESNPLNR